MQKSYDEISQITPKLYLANGYTINDSGMVELGINLVINATRDLDFQTKSEEIKRIRVPVDDNVQANLLPYFQVSRLKKHSNMRTVIEFYTELKEVVKVWGC